MAERRMFAKTIIDSDAFLEMPQSSQNLYFHLAMRADDDGFINNPKSIMRLIGCKDDDANILIAKKFLIPFESGVVVIKHWKIHNYIRNDRYNETKYVQEKSQLEYDENSAYRLTSGIPLVDERLTQDRLGKDRLGKDNTKATEPKRFVRPSVEEVKEYCDERNNGIDANAFIDFYEARGWMAGKVHMKDWKAAVRTWEQRNPKKTYGERNTFNPSDYEGGDTW